MKTQVDVNRDQFVTNGDSFSPLVKEREHGQAVLTSGNRNKDTVPILDQTIAVDRFSHQAADFFFPIDHN